MKGISTLIVCTAASGSRNLCIWAGKGWATNWGCKNKIIINALWRFFWAWPLCRNALCTKCGEIICSCFNTSLFSDHCFSSLLLKHYETQWTFPFLVHSTCSEKTIHRFRKQFQKLSWLHTRENNGSRIVWQTFDFFSCHKNVCERLDQKNALIDSGSESNLIALFPNGSIGDWGWNGEEFLETTTRASGIVQRTKIISFLRM